MNVKISVYLDTGNVFEYEVASEAKAREHAAAIVKTGYRSAQADSPNILTWWPPHRINQIKIVLPEASNTSYFDSVRAT